MSPNERGIYSITNVSDGQNTTYIGSTIQTFKLRWGIHRSALRHNRHFNDHLQRSWNKYGERAFIFSVIETVDDPEKAVVRERVWLDFYRMYVPVYNKSVVVGEGGYLGHPHSAETKEAIKKAVSGGKHYMYGKKLPEETKKRISTSLSGENNPFYGRKHSLEARRKMSEANQGKKHPCYGKQLPEATRHKISQAKAKPHPAFRHTITGEIIPAGKNLKKLSEDKGLHYSGMYWLAHGRQKICKGWILLEN